VDKQRSLLRSRNPFRQSSSPVPRARRLWETVAKAHAGERNPISCQWVHRTSSRAIEAVRPQASLLGWGSLSEEDVACSPLDANHISSLVKDGNADVVSASVFALPGHL